MNSGPEETKQTPLGRVLTHLPQEEPPSDLEARCLGALAEAECEAPPVPVHPRWEPWRQLAAAASVLMLLVGVGTLVPREGVVRDRWAVTPHSAIENGRPDGTQRAPAALPPPMPGMAPLPDAAAETPAGLAGGVRYRDDHVADAATDGVGRRPAPALPLGAPVARKAARQAGGDANGVSYGRRAEHNWTLGIGVQAPAGPAAASPKMPAASEPRTADGEQAFSSTANAPWRDRSQERRKITSREMELETPNVEQTHKQAVELIEKAGGFILEERLTVEDKGRDRAELTARLPVAQFDGVVAQLRDLGRVVLISGASADRTQDYEQQGESIRTLGSREETLVKRYEQERNPNRKALLLSQIRSLRAAQGMNKQSMQSLHHETSWATLQVWLLESKGFGYTFRRAATDALPLTFSLALIAVPVLVLVLLFRRRG